MNTRLNYIPDDGYTEPAFVEAIPLLHGDFRFRFRPCLPEERSKLLDASEKMPTNIYDRVAADAMAGKITEWDLVDAAGKCPPITAPILLRLKPALFNRVYRIVLGLDATDDDPAWSEEIKAEKAAEKYASALPEDGPQTPGQVRAGRDTKN